MSEIDRPFDWHTRARAGGAAGLPGRFFETMPGAPPASTYNDCLNRPLTPEQMELSKTIAHGLRGGANGASVTAFPPANIAAPPRSIQFSQTKTIVIGVPGTPDTEQNNSRAHLNVANHGPQGSSTFETPTIDNHVSFGSDSSGNVITQNIPPGYACVVDCFGVTTYSRFAEYYLLWTVGVGTGTAVGGEAKPTSNLIIPEQAGYPEGTAEEPATLTANKFIPPISQVPRSLIVFVRNATDNTQATLWKPTAFFARVTICGWLYYVPTISQNPEDLVKYMPKTVNDGGQCGSTPTPQPFYY